MTWFSTWFSSENRFLKKTGYRFPAAVPRDPRGWKKLSCLVLLISIHHLDRALFGVEPLHFVFWYRTRVQSTRSVGSVDFPGRIWDICHVVWKFERYIGDSLRMSEKMIEFLNCNHLFVPHPFAGRSWVTKASPSVFRQGNLILFQGTKRQLLRLMKSSFCEMLDIKPMFYPWMVGEISLNHVKSWKGIKMRELMQPIFLTAAAATFSPQPPRTHKAR